VPKDNVDEDKVEIETELEDSDFVEEHKESATSWYNGCYAIKKPSTLHNDVKSSI